MFNGHPLTGQWHHWKIPLTGSPQCFIPIDHVMAKDKVFNDLIDHFMDCHGSSNDLPIRNTSHMLASLAKHSIVRCKVFNDPISNSMNFNWKANCLPMKSVTLSMGSHWMVNGHKWGIQLQSTDCLIGFYCPVKDIVTFDLGSTATKS